MAEKFSKRFEDIHSSYEDSINDLGQEAQKDIKNLFSKHGIMSPSGDFFVEDSFGLHPKSKVVSVLENQILLEDGETFVDINMMELNELCDLLDNLNEKYK
jgi:hypothetical protein